LFETLSVLRNESIRADGSGHLFPGTALNDADGVIVVRLSFFIESDASQSSLKVLIQQAAMFPASLLIAYPTCRFPKANMSVKWT